MTIRSSDEQIPVKITREIPLYWIISTIGAILGLAVSVYVGMIRVADTVDRLNKTVEKQSIQAEQNNVTNALQTQQLADHDKRLSNIENKLSALSMQPPRR